jgi:hypothetical protein
MQCSKKHRSLQRRRFAKMSDLMWSRPLWLEQLAHADSRRNPAPRGYAQATTFSTYGEDQNAGSARTPPFLPFPGPVTVT